MTHPYRLYGWPNSGAFAVQVALEETRAPYERLWVARDEASMARFRTVNPTGKSPALALPDGTVMFESAAMLVHLGLAHPDSHLCPPPGTSRHALFLQWMVFCSANLYEPVLRLYYPERYSSRGAADAEAVKERATAEFLANLTLIGSRLAPYVLGMEYSLADVYLYMLQSWWPGDREPLYAKVPALATHAALIAARPAVAKVEADHTAAA